VPGGQYRDLPLGAQLFDVESGGRVKGAVKQGHVGPPVAQQRLLLARPTQQYLDRGGVRLGCIRVEQLGEQLGRRSGLGDENQPRVAVDRSGTLRTPLRRSNRVEGRMAFTQQHRPRLGERDASARAFEQHDAEASLKLLDCPRERRLGDSESVGRAAKVLFLRDRDEVPQLPGLHALHGSRADQTWADTGRVSAPTGSVLAVRWDAADDRGVTEQTTNEKTIALVTGANKGIGYEIAAGLGALGWSVGVGARDDGRRAAAVEKLRTAGIDAFGVPLDVTDDASAVAAARLIDGRTGRLDVLVNNAGVTGGMPQEPTQVSPEQVRAVVETNVLGVMRVTNAMLPLLRRSAAPRIVNMSSGVGSLSRQSATTDELSTGPISGAYSPSKTFLNAVTVQYAKELRDTKILINLACPGFVATDLNGFRGVRSTEQGAAIAIKLATLPDDGPTGGYFEDAGVIPW
jgi:NAD(P)-dependent dehydrogenase (short-subunit alcohol dehydrogenase family)